MKPKSVSLQMLLRLFVLFLPPLLAACGNGSYSSTPPGIKQRSAMQALAMLEAPIAAPTMDAKNAYVFSDNVIFYDPPCTPNADCTITFGVGNPVHSYAIDTVSGMPTPAGIEVDGPPLKTKSIAVPPSGRFLYMLTGDNLVYTFSIGFSIFTVADFKDQNLNPLGLYNALNKKGYITGTAFSAADIVNELNTLLQQPYTYDQLHADNSNLSETAEIVKLKAETIITRKKLFSDLTESEQKSVIRLNRLMLELAYPDKTPANKGAREQHVVGAPVTTPQAFNDTTFASIELEPRGNFAYVLGGGIVAVYVRDLATGQLTLSKTQAIGIDQLIFSPSGLIAYGSTNGSLQTYSVNRSSGGLTAVGTPFGFEAWQVGPNFNSRKGPGFPAPWFAAPFHNMAIDPTGKFLYLIGSSGTPWTPTEADCPSVETYHQMGSKIYSFVIDVNSGALTQSGSPIDTTPHIITSVSVDPKGRFVQLLNTHEYVNNQYASACIGGQTSPLNVGAIYSYYVEQASGKLIPTGSLQAGGAQIPGGFVAAGLDSVSLTGDVTGRFLYLLNAGDMYVYNVDQANGALTAVDSPLTGATTTAMPGKYETPVTWPSVCYTNGVLNTYCKLTGSRSHSLTWAGY